MGAASILAGAAAAGASSANEMAGASISAEPRPMAARIFNIESPSFVRPQIQNDSRLSHLWQILDELWMNVCLTCGAAASWSQPVVRKGRPVQVARRPRRVPPQRVEAPPPAHADRKVALKAGWRKGSSQCCNRARKNGDGRQRSAAPHSPI